MRISRKRLASTYGVLTTADNIDAVSQADIVVLAVKPQIMGAAVSPLAAALERKPIIVSIAAGIYQLQCTAKLDGSGIKNCSRFMPNAPAMVQSGAAGLFANQSLRAKPKSSY